MRRFASYGSIDTAAHYYSPRQRLLERGYIPVAGGMQVRMRHHFKGYKG